MKKLYLFAILAIALISNNQLLAQTNPAPDGIIFQALATDPQGNPAAGRTIYIKDAILQSSTNGQTVYSETFKVTASSNGVFTIVIGKGQKLSGPNSINNLDWSAGPYFLNIKAAVAPSLPLADWNADQQYIDMGTSQFWSVPFAMYASNVAGFDLKLNISDTTNMLKQYLRKSDTASLSSRIDASKISVAQETTRALAAEALKANTINVASSLVLKANVADVTSSLALKANVADVTTGLALKENIANKSTTTVLGTSDILYPTQNAVKTYVDAQINAATIVDANATTKGKLQLAGDLGGTASSPTVLTVGGSTSSNINAATILANGATNNNSNNAIVKRDSSGNFSAGTITANLSGNVTGNVTGNATNITGTVAVANGGTGATTLTGYIKGNGSNAFNTVSTIPSTDITGLVTKVNGTSPGPDGNVSIVFGHVTSDILSAKPADGTGANGDIYVVSGDATLSNNGRTFIYNGTAWNETNTNQAATDARYLQLAGGVLSGNLIIPSTKNITLTDAPSSGTDAANKNYVDTKVSTATISDATASVKGKLQLAGDLGGTADTPTVPGLALKENTANKSIATTLGTSDILYPTQNAVKTYVDAQINAATIADADATTKGKLQLAGDLGGTASSPTVLNVGGSTASNINAATGLANAATNSNTASTLVKRDASGNFSAGIIAANVVGDVTGNITGNVTGNVIGNVTGNATNVTGTVAVANGGTGATTLTGYIKGNGSNAFNTVSTIPSTDITGLVTKVNGTSPGADGNVSIVFGHVSSGVLNSKPTDGTGTNGDIYVVSGDATLINNGRTYIYNGITWNEINTNQATTDARYLQLAGGTLSGNLIMPTNKKITLTDLPISGTDAANKNYIDTKVSASSISDATESVKGKLQLAGDLGGTGTTASAPVISDNAITTVKILDANITDAKIATLSGSKVTGDISGKAANVNGTIAIANGGTGAATKAAAFDALSPLTTSGDILYGGVSGTGTRLAKGTDGQILTLASGLPTWASNGGVPYSGATGEVNLGAYDLTVNGLTIGKGLGSAPSSTVLGKSALSANSSADYIVAVGFEALKANTSGNSNTAIGYQSLHSNTSGYSNTGLGYGTLPNNINGSQNIAIGQSTLYNNTNASGNTAVGYSTAVNITTGGSNTIIGAETANGLTTGSWNTILGRNIYTGNISNNIVLGNGQGQIKAQHNGTSWTFGTIGSGTWNGTAIGIGYGGTGATTKAAAFDALSPMTASGDIVYGGTSGTGTALAKGTDGQVLTLASGLPSWTNPASSGIPYSGATGAVNLGAYDLTVNGLTIGKGLGSAPSSTVLGTSALSANSSADYIVAVGFEALKANTSGNSNTAIGYQSLHSNTSGYSNTGLGYGTLPNNINGSQNVAIGQSTLYNNTNASGNTAVGYSTAVNITTGGSNTVIGAETANGLTTGSWNTILGRNIYTGNISNNIVLGNGQGQIKAQHDGTSWTFGTIGSGTWNGTAIGIGYGGTGSTTQNFVDLTTAQTIAGGKIFSSDLEVNGVTVGRGKFNENSNTAVGLAALSNNASYANTGIGRAALEANVSGNANTAVGYTALFHNTSGANNVSIGAAALQTNISGSENTAIGNSADVASGALNNTTAIGNGATVAASNSIQLGNTSITNVKTSGTYTAGTVTYPNAHGTSGQILSTTGTGTLSWITPSTTATAFSGTLPLANGGTGASTKSTAFDALSPMTTSGDILYGGVSGTGTRLAKGTDGQILTLASGLPTWAANGGVPYTGATGAVNLGAYDLTVNGLTIGKGLNALSNNTSIGISSLSSNTTGNDNTANGFESLKNNTTGFDNTAFGSLSLRTNQNGARNTGFGRQSLYATNNANDNTAVGYLSLRDNTSGGSNVAVGSQAMILNTTAVENTALGANSMYNNTTGSGNSAIGFNSLSSNTTGGGNSAVGHKALTSNTTSTYNSAFGLQSLELNTTGSSNTAIGVAAIDRNSTGSNNAVLGAFAGRYIGDGATYNTVINNTVLIGVNSKPLADNGSNEIVIGYNAVGNGNNTVQLGNTDITNVKTSGTYTAGTVTYPNAHGTSGQILSTTGTGTLNWIMPTAVREVADEFTSSAAQVSFTLTQTPSTNSKVKMYINGIRISNTAYSVSGTTLTYTAANNGAYTLSASDRVQFDYYY